MREVVESLIGQRLEVVTVYQHWFAGEPHGQVTAFWLHFEDRPTCYLHGDGGGQTLRVDLGEPGKSVDMGEYGQMRVHAAADDHLLAGVIGLRLTEASPIHSKIQGERNRPTASFRSRR